MELSPNFLGQPQTTRQTSRVRARPGHAFTLLELVVVLGTLAVLALVLAPALAGTRMESWRLQCQSNLKQLQVGMQLFTRTAAICFRPPRMEPARGSHHLGLVDLQLHQRRQERDRESGDIRSLCAEHERCRNDGNCPRLTVVACPVDAQLPKINWMHANNDPFQPLRFAPKTYAMIGAGKSWAVDFQVDPQNGKYPLPDLNQPNRRGVGIYWQSSSGNPDWEAKGYKTSVVKDPGEPSCSRNSPATRAVREAFGPVFRLVRGLRMAEPGAIFTRLTRLRPQRQPSCMPVVTAPGNCCIRHTGTGSTICFTMATWRR